MNERSRNVAVGLTVFVGICGMLVMMLLFGYVPAWLERSYPVTVYLPESEGLTQGSPVRLHGISVGTVDRVAHAAPPEHRVIALVNVRENVRLPANVEATVSSPFFGGATTLELHVPTPVDPEVGYLPADGTAQLTGRASLSLHEIADEMRRAMEQPVADFERIADRVESLGNEWTRVGRNVNLLLEPREPDAVDRGEAPSNLHSLVARTDARLAQLEELIDGAGALLADEQLHDDVRRAASGARELSERLPRDVENLSENMDRTLEALRSRYVALADDLSGAVAVMTRLAERAERGEGTVGRMLADPALYDGLQDTIERTQAAIDDLRLLIQKWHAEGVPIQW